VVIFPALSKYRSSKGYPLPPPPNHKFKLVLFFVTGTFKVKAGLAQMAKGGIIMDVTTAEEAKIAENAGVCNKG